MHNEHQQTERVDNVIKECKRVVSHLKLWFDFLGNICFLAESYAAFQSQSEVEFPS